MSDFKKGLLVGMLIIIGCGVFVANSSDNDNGRFEFHTLQTTSALQPLLIDTKTGDTFYINGEVSKNQWIKWKSINNNTKSK